MRGINQQPDEARNEVEGDLTLHIEHFYSGLEKFSEKHQIHTVVYVEDEKGNYPFVEMFPVQITEEQEEEVIEKFKKNPLSFNNQRQTKR